MVIPPLQCPSLKGTSPNFALNTSCSLPSLPSKKSLGLSSIFSLEEVYSFRIEFGHSLVWFWQVLKVLVWFRLVWYGFVRNGIVGPEGSFNVLNSLKWNCMVMESLIWSFMVCMIVCGLIWLSIVYYANVFPCKVSNGLVWLCMVLYGLTQLCTIFVLVFQC